MGDWGDHSRRGRALLGIGVGLIVHILGISAKDKENCNSQKCSEMEAQIATYPYFLFIFFLWERYTASLKE